MYVASFRHLSSESGGTLGREGGARRMETQRRDTIRVEVRKSNRLVYSFITT